MKNKQKTRLHIFYNFMKELSAYQFDKEDIKIGLSKNEFEKIKIENLEMNNFAFNQTKELEDFDNVNEFKFNTGFGQMTIFNKDFK